MEDCRLDGAHIRFDEELNLFKQENRSWLFEEFAESLPDEYESFCREAFKDARE